MLTQRAAIDGSEPVAVALHGNFVYMLNAGGSSQVVGFLVNGRLTSIPVQIFSTNASGAASLTISPDGQVLAVTEKLTNRIDIVRLQDDGTLG